MEKKQKHQQPIKNQNSENHYAGSKPTKKYQRRSPNSIQPEANSKKLRPVFAAYLNMARANLYAVLRHISVITGLNVNKDEEHMEQLPVSRFANQKHPEVRQKVYTLLYKHIPCLKHMSQAYIKKGKLDLDGNPIVEEHKTVTQSDLQKLLQNIIRTLNYQRNEFTHADHYNTENEREAEFKRQSDLFRPLSCAFIGAKRETSRIFNYNADDMFFIDQKERMERTNELNEDGKPIYREHEDWYFRLFTRSAKYIRNDQGDIEINDDDGIIGENESLQLTSAGLIFLICKFLHKKYATQFAQQTGLFRTRGQSGNSPFSIRENEVMFNIFCAHRIRLPKGRIESNTDKSALGLDMLNELQKCPKELFETFSPADRSLFQIVRNGNTNTPNPDDDVNLFRRNNDRFAQLALKYIDSLRTDPTELSDTFEGPLKTIVFQIAIGKYRYKFYNRASLDTDVKDRVRVLQKEVNGFGPLSKIEELRDGDNHKGQYSSIIRRVSNNEKQLYSPDTADTKPYLTDHHASYAITGNRIGLMWDTTRENGVLNPDTLCYLPKLPLPELNPKNNSWSVDKSVIESNAVPRAWLSIYDLPALIFLHLLGGNPEKVIKEKYKNLKKLFNDIAHNKFKPIFSGEVESKCVKRKQQIECLKKQLELILAEKYKGVELKDIPAKLTEYLTIGAVSNCDSVDVQFTKWIRHQLNGYPSQIDNNGHVAIRAYKGLIASLEDRIAKFNQDLKIIGDKQNRLGRKSYVDVRPGSLARYLSKDIVRMTIADNGKDNGGKPTGLDFAVLQSSIATYNNNNEIFKKTLLGQMLQHAIPLENHPFLCNMMGMKIKDTISFYLTYQKQKLKWLKKRAEKEDFLQNAHFMYFMRESYRNFLATSPDLVISSDGNENHVKGLAERYLDTLYLPDGLFTNAIRKQLAENEDTRENPFIVAALKDEIKGHSAAYLLNVYFTHVLNDKSQTFYRNQGDLYKRHYKLLDILYPNSKGYLTENDLAVKLKKCDGNQSNIRKKINSHVENLEIVVKKYDRSEGRKVSYYAPADEETKNNERIKLMHQLRDLQHNEQVIRRYRNEDMLLFLMAQKLLLKGGFVFKNKADAGGMQKFRLQDITPPAYNVDNKKSLLDIPIDFSITFGLNDENGHIITGEDGKQIKRTIRQKDIKIKNYGDFFAFLYDSRIGGLLSQLPLSSDDIIERSDLDKELDIYDRKRLKVFAVLQAIERKIINEHPELADTNAGGIGFYDEGGKPYRNSFSGLLSLCKQYMANEKDLNDMGYGIVDIRNAFSHNRYTSDNNKHINISKMNLPQVAELILKWLEKA